MRRLDLLKGLPGGRVLALMVALSLSGCTPTPALEVTDAWLRPPLPGKTVAAGYVTVRNRSAQAATLIALSSPQATRVELHIHQYDGDMLRMRKLDRLEIAGGRSIVLEPGGEHLMLFDVGILADTAKVTFEFADGTVLSANFDVRKLVP